MSEDKRLDNENVTTESTEFIESDCEKARELISALVDGEELAPEEEEFLYRHTVSCKDCRAFWRDLEKMKKLPLKTEVKAVNLTIKRTISWWQAVAILIVFLLPLLIMLLKKEKATVFSKTPYTIKVAGRVLETTGYTKLAPPFTIKATDRVSIIYKDLFINQLLGEIKLSPKKEITWLGGSTTIEGANFKLMIGPKKIYAPEFAKIEVNMTDDGALLNVAVGKVILNDKEIKGKYLIR